MQGRCLCGQIRLKADPLGRLWTAYCHCDSCRRATGAPVSAYVSLRDSAWVWSRGQPQIRHSSPGVRRGFCGACGTPISYVHGDHPGETHFHAALFGHTDETAPERHDFWSERLPWLSIDDDLPKHG